MDDQSAKDIEKQNKRYLKRYRNNIECISRLEAKRDDLEYKLKSLRSANISGMPRGGIPVTEADMIADKADLEARIVRLTAKGRILKSEVCAVIDTLEDPRHCEVLESFYIECLSMDEIAQKMNYTERHIHALFQEAISFISISLQ